MSAEVAAAKAAVAVASDKRGRVAIATILCSIIMLFFLPLIVYMGVMSNLGEMEIDTVQAQQMIVQNMSAEEKAKLQHLEDVMIGIGKEFQKRKLNNYTIKKAQALYACALYDIEKTDSDFITKYADCFEQSETDDDLRNAVFSAFGIAIDKTEFDNLMSVIKNTVIDIDLTDTDKNNLDLVKWAQFAYDNKWGYVWGSHGQVLTEKELNRLKGVFGSYVTDKEAYIREHWLGRRTADCVGLIKGYGWYNEESGTIKYGTNGMKDVTADGMYSAAIEKINFIIEELEKDENISELYNLWCKYNDKIIEMYQQTKTEYIPLSQNKTFKPLKNIIIKEALNICYDEISFDDIEDEDDEPIEDEYIDKTFYESHPGLYEYQMAKMYLDINSGSYDTVLGIKYLKESADLGYEFAVYKLGKYYMNGEYVKKNLHKVEELLLKVSNMDNCYAQYRLAKLYLDNNGGLFDSDKGLDYLFKSASNGYKYALYQLGKIYYNGKYVEKDINKAILYLISAAEKDCECAEKLLEYINNNSKEWQSYSAVLAVLNDLSKLFKKEFDNKYKLVSHTDRKTLQKINEKKQAMGLKF